MITSVSRLERKCARLNSLTASPTAFQNARCQIRLAIFKGPEYLTSVLVVLRNLVKLAGHAIFVQSLD